MSEHNQKHLTLSNRTYIEQELLQKNIFSSIGNVLHKDPSTISKEVKRYYKTVSAKYSYKFNLCKHYKDCDLMSKKLKCLDIQAIALFIARNVIEEPSLIIALIFYLTNTIKPTNLLMFVITVRITNPVLWTRKYMMLLMSKGNTRRVFIILAKAFT